MEKVRGKITLGLIKGLLDASPINGKSVIITLKLKPYIRHEYKNTILPGTSPPIPYFLVFLMCQSLFSKPEPLKEQTVLCCEVCSTNQASVCSSQLKRCQIQSGGPTTARNRNPICCMKCEAITTTPPSSTILWPKSNVSKVRAYCSAFDHLIRKIFSGVCRDSHWFEEYLKIIEIDDHFFV